MCQQRDQLGDVHGAAAAEADDQIDPGRPGLRHRRQDDVLGRVGNDLIVNRDLQPFRLEARQDFVEQAETGDARVGHHQHRARPTLLAKAGQPA